LRRLKEEDGKDRNKWWRLVHSRRAIKRKSYVSRIHLFWALFNLSAFPDFLVSSKPWLCLWLQMMLHIMCISNACYHRELILTKAWLLGSSFRKKHTKCECIENVTLIWLMNVTIMQTWLVSWLRWKMAANVCRFLKPWCSGAIIVHNSFVQSFF